MNERIIHEEVGREFSDHEKLEPQLATRKCCRNNVVPTMSGEYEALRRGDPKRLLRNLFGLRAKGNKSGIHQITSLNSDPRSKAERKRDADTDRFLLSHLPDQDLSNLGTLGL